MSPLLANIYLHELDRYMESKYLNLSRDDAHHAERRQERANYLYVRYADDFVVLCNGTKAEALAMKEELKELLEHHGTDALRGKDESHPYNRRIHIPRIQDH